MLIELFVSCLDDFETGELLKKKFSGNAQFNFQISKQGHSAEDGNGFLQIWSGKLWVIFLHLVGEFDLFEIGNSEKHSFLIFVVSLEIEVVVVLRFIVRWVGHSMMNYHWLQGFYCLILWISVLNFGAPFVMEIDYTNADYRLLVLAITLIVLLNHLF